MKSQQNFDIIILVYTLTKLKKKNLSVNITLENPDVSFFDSLRKLTVNMLTSNMNIGRN